MKTFLVLFVLVFSTASAQIGFQGGSSGKSSLSDSTRALRSIGNMKNVIRASSSTDTLFYFLDDNGAYAGLMRLATIGGVPRMLQILSASSGYSGLTFGNPYREDLLRIGLNEVIIYATTYAYGGLAEITSIHFSNTVTPSGVTGNQTINQPSGTVNIAAGGTSVTVTNNLVNTNSIVFAVIRSDDATATIKNVVPANGSFTINLTSPATAEVSIGFFVIRTQH